MAQCADAYFNGWGVCSSMMELMNGSLLQDKGKTWTDTTAISEDAWHTAIADDDKAIRSVLPIPIMSFENTTDDVTIDTSPLGKSSISAKPIPKGIIYLDASICDYKHIHALGGVSYEFFPTFQDGSMWGTRKSDGTIKGFRVKLGTKAGLPPDDKNQSFPIYLFFDSYTEFEDVVVINPDFNFSDLLDYTPAGLDVLITTAYAAGDVVIKVTERGTGAGHTGLAAADFEVMASNGAPLVSVTAAVDDGLGQYTLTIQEDSAGTPADLSSGEYAVVQAHDDDATYLTYLSHAFKVTG